jgi:precorrin-6Y C5,15-methyltransferase (decarboxylating)
MGSYPTDRILVVGLPAMGPAGLPATVVSRVQEAEVLCGGERHLALFPGVGKERWTIAGDVPQLVERLRDRVGKRVVVLASGDPLLYGIGATLACSLGADRLEIIPQVSAVQEAFARVCVPWHDARIVSAHGRPIEPAVAAVLAHPKVAIYTDSVHTPAHIAMVLLARGSPDRRVVVAERLGEPGEQLWETTLAGLSERSFAPLNVMLVLELVEETARLSKTPGEIDDAALMVRSGQMTRQEVRVLSVARLGVRSASVIWDVGAGSGAVSIEMAYRNPVARIFAIERDPDQRLCVRTNLERTGVASVMLVEGEAPEALEKLPEPQAIFIGGTGGRLTEILDCCWTSLAQDGRLVANFVVLGHLNEFLTWCTRAGVIPEVLLVQLSRGVPIVGSLRLEPFHPVFIVKVCKGAGACKAPLL